MPASRGAHSACQARVPSGRLTALAPGAVLGVDVGQVGTKGFDAEPVLLVAFPDHVAGVVDGADRLRIETVEEASRRAGAGDEAAMVNLD